MASTITMFLFAPSEPAAPGVGSVSVAAPALPLMVPVSAVVEV